MCALEVDASSVQLAIQRALTRSALGGVRVGGLRDGS